MPSSLYFANGSQNTYFKRSVPSTYFGKDAEGTYYPNPPQTYFGSVFSSEALALFSAMTVQPSANSKIAINNLINALIVNNIWSNLDFFYVTAAHDSQAACLNWKNPSTFTLTPTNSPTFTTNKGFAGNASTSYVNTGWIPATNAVNFSLNAGSFGISVEGGSDVAANLSVGGVLGLNSTFIDIRPRFTGDLLRAAINQTTIVASGSVTTRAGLSAISRLDAATNRYFKNGTSLGNVATASSAIPTTYPIWFCALNGQGTISAPSNNIVKAGFIGGLLTDAQHLVLYNSLETYYSAIAV